MFLILSFNFSIMIYCQDSIKHFPDKVNLKEFKKCTSRIDTPRVKKKIFDKDFSGYKASYDYSRFKFIDLNKDGACEVLHYFSSALRGWPHDFLTIYIMEDTLFKKIGDFPSFLLSFAESDGEYLQINYGYIKGHKTNPIYYNSVYRFNGNEYSQYYSPNMTIGEFQNIGLDAYKKGNYQKAYICFKNALLTHHHNKDELLKSANDVAITLIKLNRFKEVRPLLRKYIKNCNDNKYLAAAYYNIGLAMENLNNFNKALENFKKSCEYRETNACRTKINKYKR